MSNNKAANSAQADAQLLKKNAELENKVQELESTIVDIEKERDFYGVTTIVDEKRSDYRFMLHGRIVHGLQSMSPDRLMRTKGRNNSY